MDKSLILQPRLSEKAYGVSVQRNTFVFVVPKSANKHTIARAVASQFEVTVTEVNTMNMSGKAKRTVRKGGRAVAGRQSDFKKAYVTLAEGSSLPFFAAEEEAAEEEAKATEKAAKKATKEAAKKEKKGEK